MIMTRDDNVHCNICLWNLNDPSMLIKDGIGLQWECEPEPGCGEWFICEITPKQFKQIFPNTPLPRKGSKKIVQLNISEGKIYLS